MASSKLQEEFSEFFPDLHHLHVGATAAAQNIVNQWLQPTTSPKQRHVEYQGNIGQTVQPVGFFANVISLKQKRLYRGALQASSDNK